MVLVRFEMSRQFLTSEEEEEGVATATATAIAGSFGLNVSLPWPWCDKDELVEGPGAEAQKSC